MTERWLPLPGFEGGYEVSDQGCIRSVDRIIHDSAGRTRRHKGRPIRLSPSPDGYIRYEFHFRGQASTQSVHRLVARAFIGPLPPGMEVLHRNGDRIDNRVENLRYGTHAENIRDSVRHGTHAEARKTHCPRNHPYSGDNVWVVRTEDGGIKRRCRACARQRMRNKKMAPDVSRGQTTRKGTPECQLILAKT